MGYKVAVIEELRDRLMQLPEVDNKEREVSKQEAIRIMSDAVCALQQRGYGLEQIAEIITKEGMPISVATLKSYLTRVKRTSSAIKGTKRGGNANSTLVKKDKKKALLENSEVQNRPQEKNDIIPAEPRKSKFIPRKDSDNI